MSALDDLPVAARDLLTRGDRDGNRLTGAEAEHVAAMLLETGIGGGAALEWMARHVRFRCGVGERPAAMPAVTGMQRYAAGLAGERAETVARGVLASRGRAT